MSIDTALDKKRLLHYLILALTDDPEQDDDFNPMDMYGGNFDDAYEGGYTIGGEVMEIDMSRQFLTDLGFEWSKWVLVTERLPEHGQHVYGINDEGNIWSELWDEREPLGKTRAWRLV